jgi:hypothetical protein
MKIGMSAIHLVGEHQPEHCIAEILESFIRRLVWALS